LAGWSQACEARKDAQNWRQMRKAAIRASDASGWNRRIVLLKPGLVRELRFAEEMKYQVRKGCSGAALMTASSRSVRAPHFALPGPR